MMKTRSLMMKKCRNLKNEIKTRWGDSINVLYCSHIINKNRRSYRYIAMTQRVSCIYLALFLSSLLIDNCKYSSWSAKARFRCLPIGSKDIVRNMDPLDIPRTWPGTQKC